MSTIPALIRATNDRLQWDGIWEDTVRRVAQDGRDLHVVLDEACRLVDTPRLLIVPWSVACELLRHNHEVWRRSASLPSAYPFRRDLDAERLFMLEQGYVGRYREAVVIASIYADDPWGGQSHGIVASVANPSDVEYDGSNCVLVYFECAPGSDRGA